MGEVMTRGYSKVVEGRQYSNVSVVASFRLFAV